jgi:DNA-binding NarL/FixJ family response regulator
VDGAIERVDGRLHLRRVYRKLDVRSRAELIKHFAANAG